MYIYVCVPEYQGIVATPKAMEYQGGVDQCQRNWTLRLHLHRLWIVFRRFGQWNKADLPTFSSSTNYGSD